MRARGVRAYVRLPARLLSCVRVCACVFRVCVCVCVRACVRVGVGVGVNVRACAFPPVTGAAAGEAADPLRGEQQQQ